MYVNGFAQIQVSIAPYYQGRQAALSLTFDDGLMDQYTLARTELNKRGLRATFAVIGSKLDVKPLLDIDIADGKLRSCGIARGGTCCASWLPMVTR